MDASVVHSSPFGPCAAGPKERTAQYESIGVAGRSGLSRTPSSRHVCMINVRLDPLTRSPVEPTRTQFKTDPTVTPTRGARPSAIVTRQSNAGGVSGRWGSGPKQQQIEQSTWCNGSGTKRGCHCVHSWVRLAPICKEATPGDAGRWTLDLRRSQKRVFVRKQPERPCQHSGGSDIPAPVISSAAIATRAAGTDAGRCVVPARIIGRHPCMG